MDKVAFNHITFHQFITTAQIASCVEKMASEISADYQDTMPVLIPVLNGAFMLAADLMRAITIPAEISFMKIESYHGDHSSGKVKALIGCNMDLRGRKVIIVEDIIDTGLSIDYLIKEVEKKEPEEIRVASLLFKPDACVKEIKIDYLGMEIPNDFVIGYGMDFDGYGRNLNAIYRRTK